MKPIQIDGQEYYTSPQASALIGKGSNYFTVIRHRDRLRKEKGKDAYGPPYYQAAHSKNAYYRKEDVLKWLVNRQIQKAGRLMLKG